MDISVIIVSNIVIVTVTHELPSYPVWWMGIFVIVTVTYELPSYPVWWMGIFASTILKVYRVLEDHQQSCPI